MTHFIALKLAFLSWPKSTYFLNSADDSGRNQDVEDPQPLELALHVALADLLQEMKTVGG